MNDELIGALRQANHDYTNEAADLIEAQASRMERLDARIVELKAEAKLWWDENLKKQTACEQMGKRIAELEAALRQIEADCNADYPPSIGAIKYAARAALEGRRDDPAA